MTTALAHAGAAEHVQAPKVRRGRGRRASALLGLKPCSMAGCPNPHHTKGCRAGLCRTHTKRAQRGMSMDKPIRRWGRSPDGKTNSRRYLDKLAELGTCVRCVARPARPRNKTCESCALAQRVYDGKVRVVRSVRGLCRWCGVAPARADRTTCPRCAEKQRGLERAARVREMVLANEPGVRAARCRCGLLLPCNNCLPTSAAAYALIGAEFDSPDYYEINRLWRRADYMARRLEAK